MTFDLSRVPGALRTARGGALRALIAATLLGGCAETQLAIHGVKEITAPASAPAAKPEAAPETAPSALGAAKIGDPYQIDGVWYYPKADPNYDKVGIASWYGEDFHGKRTANGAVYDMNALTAAHKTLPMPSKVRVTNLSNGRSLLLDINDRGPFVNGRIIDVSRRAAQLLGFDNHGLAMVRVEAVSPAGRLQVAKQAVTTAEERALVSAVPTTPVAVAEIKAPEGARAAQPLPPAAGRPVAARLAAASPPSTPDGATVTPPVMFIQAGAFLQQQNASTLSGRLAVFGPVRVIPVELDGRLFYRVRLGPLADVEEADRLLREVIRAGFAQARMVVD